ncbi:MAG: ATP-binding cassette domain-containing protein [bacterium]|nr:ATP-binding cassette domain-containing protein [bacterium]
MTENKNIIHFENVNIFQQDSLVLSDVNFTINSSEFFYLIGTTGSGKSTLLKSIYGELPIQKGKASVVGFQLESLNKSKIPSLRRNLGVVFQDFQLLFDRDVNENLNFVLQATGWKNKDEINSRIHEVLSMVDLATKGHKMPFELSGGEQQRIAIARALLNKPALILADEPTGNLDPKTSDDILSLLHQISKTGTAVIMATHDYRILDKFPANIMRCEQGKVLNNKLLTKTTEEAQ